jgi:hypothetical protein
VVHRCVAGFSAVFGLMGFLHILNVHYEPSRIIAHQGMNEYGRLPNEAKTEGLAQ